MDWKKLLAGAVLGAIGALTADAHSASKSVGSWDWKIALNRASAGAVVGAAGAAGISIAS